MEDRSSTAQKADIQTSHIEPIFDASGTLRRIPSDTAKPGSVDDIQFARRASHPAR
jgi:alpha-D-ribose 1-methylphosphonate 5-triphosphate synthase subunit PhnH